MGRTQQQVIDAALVPTWYWCVVAVLTVGLGGVVDSGRSVLVATAVPVFVVVVAGMTVWMILGRGRAQLSSALMDGPGAARIVGFVGVVVLGSLGTGFVLDSRGASAPATIATLVGAAGVAFGGPLLMRSLRRMLLKTGTHRR